MIRLNPAQIFTSLYSHKFDCWSVYSHKTAKCTDTPDASSNYLMMHQLCVCVRVSRVCLCTVRVCCGSDSAWSLTRILICFCYFPPDSLFTFLPRPLFEHEVQFHSSGEAHTYSFFFFFCSHLFDTHFCFDSRCLERKTCVHLCIEFVCNRAASGICFAFSLNTP